MNVRPFVLAGAFALATFAAGAARADTVKLKNGDTLTGTIVSVLDGKLTLIPATNIGSIEISPVPSEPMKWVIRDVQALA